MKKMLWGIVLAMVILLPIGANAASINYSWERWCSGTCEQTYTFTVDNLNGATTLSPSLTLTGDAEEIEVVSVEGADGWSATSSRDGNKVTINFTREGATTSNNLGTLTLRLNNYNTDHSATLELDGVVTVVAKATTTLNRDGSTTPIGDEELTNPDTGAFMNYTLIAGGIGIAATILFLSKKNKKLYKI